VPTPRVICFYSVAGEYGQLSNFAAYPIVLDTGDAMLVEHTDQDELWGDGGDGSGRNELGRIVMAVRDRLREQPR